MGETSTNIATLNMNDALKVRVKDGCDVEDPCSSSPCPPHSRCRDAWDAYSCICDKGGSPAHTPRHPAAPEQRAVLWPRKHTEESGLGAAPDPCGSAEGGALSLRSVPSLSSLFIFTYFCIRFKCLSLREKEGDCE